MWIILTLTCAKKRVPPSLLWRIFFLRKGRRKSRWKRTKRWTSLIERMIIMGIQVRVAIAGVICVAKRATRIDLYRG